MPRGEEMDLCKQNFTEVNLKQQLISTSTEYPYPHPLDILPTTPPVSMLTATTAALVTRDNIWPGIKRSSVLRLSVDSLIYLNALSNQMNLKQQFTGAVVIKLP